MPLRMNSQAEMGVPARLVFPSMTTLALAPTAVRLPPKLAMVLRIFTQAGQRLAQHEVPQPQVEGQERERDRCDDAYGDVGGDVLERGIDDLAHVRRK